MRKEAARGPKDRRDNAGGAVVLRATAAQHGSLQLAASRCSIRCMAAWEIDRSFSTPFQHSGLLSRDGASSLPTLYGV